MSENLFAVTLFFKIFALRLYLKISSEYTYLTNRATYSYPSAYVSVPLKSFSLLSMVFFSRNLQLALSFPSKALKELDYSFNLSVMRRCTVMLKLLSVLPLKGHSFVTFPVTNPTLVTPVNSHYIS